MNESRKRTIEHMRRLVATASVALVGCSSGEADKAVAVKEDPAPPVPPQNPSASATPTASEAPSAPPIPTPSQSVAPPIPSFPKPPPPPPQQPRRFEVVDMMPMPFILPPLVRAVQKRVQKRKKKTPENV